MCMPKFLFILHGKVEDEVIGANIPEFNEKVRKYCTPNEVVVTHATNTTNTIN